MPVSILSKRLGLFAELSGANKGNLGRTALMKLCYFLQALRGVPLGYKFSLYSYGPFDSDVLADLQTAENMGVLQARIEYYPGGYKYDIQPDEKSADAIDSAKEFLSEYKADINWVVKTFGNRNSAELELLSTILYLHENREIENRNELAEQVKTVKPHFSPMQIECQIDWLDENNLLD